MSQFFRRLHWLMRRPDKEAELREELEFHLEEEAEAREEHGMPPQAARLAARRELGNLALVQEDTRAAWGWTALEQLAQDVRYAFRTMAANRLFTLLAVCSLALGIGANAAIYSFMDAILLRALPVADPQSLVLVNWHAKPNRHDRDFVMYSMSGSTWGDTRTGVSSGMFPYPAFELLQRNSPVFASVFGHFQIGTKLNVAVRGHADIAGGEFVTGDFFRGLGVAPAAGRLILPDDDRTGAPAVAVVSHAYSEKRLGGAAHAAGQVLLINNLPFLVVGVAPPGFSGIDPAAVPDIYLPMHANQLAAASSDFGFARADYLDGNYYWIQIMARLRPGVSRARAQAVLAPQFRQWVAGTAANDKERANLPELVLDQGAGGLGGLRREYSHPLYVLLTLVALILALACANVANLLLARSAARSREMALRLSVGAGRFRIVRQLLTESVLLASLGGILGVILAVVGIRFLTLLLAHGDADFTLHAELNWRVLGVAAALALLTGVLFGLAPALRATRVDVMPALKEARMSQPRTRRGFGWLHTGNVLVAAQIAISLVMLVAAGLFLRTLSSLHSIPLGFDRDNVLLFQMDARKAGHADPEISAFYGELRRRFAEMPGVRLASLSHESLIRAGTGFDLAPVGQKQGEDDRDLMVGPDFFATMGIRLKAGRDIEESDRVGSPAVAVVNEVYARERFGNRNPLGEHLIVRDRGKVERDMEIVGVAENARYGALTDAIPPVVYMPYNQGYPQPNQMVYALRTHGDPLRYADAVREMVRRADSRTPVTDMRTQAMDIDQTINQPITFAELCSGFAILALVIACVGLYGTVSYNVARRTGEIGIRMALGAQRGGVIRMVLRDVLLLAVAGLAVGMAAALNSAQFVASFLYEIKPNDPIALTAAGIVLLTAALLAAYLPARKASRMDPMTALRNE